MKCQNPKCGKDTCIIYINENHERLCPDCYEEYKKRKQF